DGADERWGSPGGEVPMRYREVGEWSVEIGRLLATAERLGAGLKFGLDDIILRTPTNRLAAATTSDQLDTAGQNQSNLKDGSLSTTIRARQDNKRVGASIRTAEIKFQPVDPAKVADRERRDPD